MNIFFKIFKKKSDHGEVEALEAAPILLINGEYFFSEKVLLPQEVSAKNLDSFLEMSIEGLSPFPVEHLYWGYFYDKEESAVLLYAMYVERLSAEEKAAVLGDEVAYVFPSFIVGFGGRYEERTITFVKVGATLSAFFWEAGSAVPFEVESVIIEESIEDAREELLRLGRMGGGRVQAGYWELEKTEFLPNRSVRFESKYSLEGAAKADHVFILTEKDGLTWNADIRPRFLTREKHKQEKRARVLWYTVLGAVFMFGLFAVGELMGFVGNWYLGSLKERYKAQEAKVKFIEGQESLVQKIEHLGHNYYAPLEMLALLNEGRPKKVYFTSATLGNKNNVVVEGVAQTVDDLNKYTDDLNKSGLVEKLEVGQIVSRQGRITFKMDLTFKVAQKEKEKEEEKEPLVVEEEETLSEEEPVEDEGLNEQVEDSV